MVYRLPGPVQDHFARLREDSCKPWHIGPNDKGTTTTWVQKVERVMETESSSKKI